MLFFSDSSVTSLSQLGSLSFSYVTSGQSCKTREEGKMADKFTEFAGRMGKAPKGVGTGLKFLVAAAAAAYGIKESIYTGIILSSWLRLES